MILTSLRSRFVHLLLLFPRFVFLSPPRFSMYPLHHVCPLFFTVSRIFTFPSNTRYSVNYAVMRGTVTNCMSIFTMAQTWATHRRYVGSTSASLYITGLGPIFQPHTDIRFVLTHGTSKSMLRNKTILTHFGRSRCVELEMYWESNKCM